MAVYTATPVALTATYQQLTTGLDTQIVQVYGYGVCELVVADSLPDAADRGHPLGEKLMPSMNLSGMTGKYIYGRLTGSSTNVVAYVTEY